jgi:hypothetical protein
VTLATEANDRSGPGLGALIAIVGVGGLMVGALTSVGQGSLPEALGSLANSAGSWSLAAFVLTLANRVPWRGAILGALALAAMVVGYAVATEMRGFPMSMRLVAFWGLAALTVGPALGVGAAWTRGPDLTRRALAAGLLGGILIGEAAYGLTVVADTTSPAYWIVQALTGVVIVVGSCAWRLRTSTPILVCLASTAVVAVAFYVAYVAAPVVLLSG